MAEIVKEEGESRFRKLSGSLEGFTRITTIIFAIFLLMYIVGFFTSDWVFLPRQTFRGLGLGTGLLLFFLKVPVRSADSHRVPWYDWLLAICGALSSYYFAAVYPTRIGMAHLVNTWELLLGIMAVVAVIEAGRRAMGWAFFILVVVFFFYPMLSGNLPGFLQGRGYSFYRVIEQMYMFDVGIYGSFLDIALTTLFTFLLFAGFLIATGAQKFFLDFALSLVGYMRGGPAKVAVIGSGLMGTMTGSAVANVVGTGSITIPLMKNTGYPGYFAGAVEAVASTGGQLVPPVMGAVAFLMAEVIGVSYWNIVVYALLPAILYYLALFIMVDLEAGKLGLKGLPRAQLPSIRKTLSTGWYYIIPILLLVYLLGGAGFSPENSALYSLVVLVALTFFKPETRVTLKKVFGALENAIYSSFEIIIICALMGIIAGAVNMTGLGSTLASGIVNLAGGNLFILLLLAAVACYIFGMGLPTISQYILLALLVAPAIVKLGVPVVAAHMFILYWGLTSHLTPPVAPAAFVAAGIAGAPPLKTAFQAMQLGISLLLVPFAFVFAPGMLLLPGYPLIEIVQPIVTSIIGVVYMSIGISGYLLRTIGPWGRAIMIAAGVMCIIPELYTDIIGIVLGLAVIAFHVIQARATREQRVTSCT